MKEFQGNIALKKVSFQYPSRPGVHVLKELDLQAEAGKSLAIVGSSGSGKSTILQLIQRYFLFWQLSRCRFYDPESGSISIGGVELKEFDLQWLRSKMAVVSQEPILFEVSIRENIRWGRLDATDTEVEEAAKQVCVVCAL